LIFGDINSNVRFETKPKLWIFQKVMKNS
jgi:hypothetical protein